MLRIWEGHIPLEKDVAVTQSVWLVTDFRISDSNISLECFSEKGATDHRCKVLYLFGRTFRTQTISTAAYLELLFTCSWLWDTDFDVKVNLWSPAEGRTHCLLISQVCTVALYPKLYSLPRELMVLNPWCTLGWLDWKISQMPIPGQGW